MNALRFGATGLRRRSRAGAVVGLVVGMLLGALGVAAPAHAQTSPVFTLAGRGWGHGIGMSQWGAYGAATQGLTWREIVAFYYPGTTQQDGYAGRTIRVQLSALRGAPLTVLPAAGLLVAAGTCTQTLPVSADTTQWRVARGASGWTLERRSTAAGGWVEESSSCPLASAPDVMFRTTSWASTSTVTVVLPSGSTRDYRGWVSAVPNGASSLDTVNTLNLEQYLYSVVPSEMPPSWHAQGLAAQAVAARTYAAARLGASGAWDICDTTACQVYSGRPTEYTASTAAVDATSGVVLTYGGSVVTAMFSAYNGGQTAAANAPYLVSQKDPYEAGFSTPNATWRVRIAAASIERAWPAIGTFREIVVRRDGHGRWGGRAVSVDLVGTGGTVTVTGSRFQSQFGLKSTYYAPEADSVGADLAANAFSDVVGRDGSSRLLLYPGNGRGGWLKPRVLAAAATGIRQVLSPGDLDGDGLDDVLVVTTAGYLELRPVQPDGTLGPARRVGSGWRGYSEIVGPGDLTGDGFPDLVARDSAGVLWIYRGDGSGSWLGRTSLGSGWGSLRELTPVGDFDGDGGSDILARDRTGALRLYSFSPTGVRTGMRVVGSGWSTYSQLTGPGDFDGDGHPDLLARDSAGRLWLYRSSGTGTWLGRVQVGSGWGSFLDIDS
ncbi:SpoIID/LytB domain-containing protein [Phycicoccus duodecadis]|uniref:SpoIID/LytB domain protein n=1 Tax=Phycicoccus duodecadis TaxID=173053 RepID=A0A2N3YK40_9MICO|nr:SpoIID/LytB domain-containing protein [Phycicoccus duodecadis]PKW27216.1 SpoIID/LytB domain protein [Phycicoccus duodecadis]